MLALADGFGEAPCAGLLPPGTDPQEVLRSPPAPPHVPPRVAARLRAAGLREEAAALRRRAEARATAVLTPADDAWPTRLDAHPAPPLALFVRGDAAALRRAPSAAVVGSRTPTPYGRDAATELADALARAGVAVWSGLARGVDGAAHEASLAGGAPAVAVLAGGLDRLYPPEHKDLADRIVAAGGCLISELPCDRRARRGHFLRRNRLLGAGPLAVAVVEASLASGALSTARFAAESGTDVYCVPGPWRSERSQGCHRLIAEGAGVLESPDALLHGLGFSTPDATAALELALDADAEAVLQALRTGPRPTDLLRREAGLERPQFLRAIEALARTGAAERLDGDLWRRVSRGQVGSTAVRTR